MFARKAREKGVLGEAHLIKSYSTQSAGRVSEPWGSRGPVWVGLEDGSGGRVASGPKDGKGSQELGLKPKDHRGAGDIGSNFQCGVG